MKLLSLLGVAAGLVVASVASADLLVDEQTHDLSRLPLVPAPFKIGFYAREPMLMHPSALTFDVQGRLFVGAGPQFRRPTPQTPPDSVLLLIDDNRDGVADEAKTFATGFNSIQGLAWRGKDLYVANAPDLTLVRDLDGDDIADEYIKIFDGLGHNRHGLHGLTFGPDGWLYMSQGNSGVTSHAPKPFRDLMGVSSNAPATQQQRLFSPQAYKHGFVDKWPELEGGLLRSKPDGTQLQIFARGMRNPFDIDFDANFDWLATDNDAGPEHDRVITPFAGAHFGKRHPWFDSWDGVDSPGTVPLSGLFPNANGSGVGVLFYTAAQWPVAYQNVFLIGDWIRKSIYAYRSEWKGAQRHGVLEEIFHARGTEALFRPTDITVGPDGALYIAGWGSHYGSKQAPYQKGDDTAELNEGRVFRMWNTKADLVATDERFVKVPLTQWTTAALTEVLGHFLPSRNVAVQQELLRREPKTVAMACRARLMQTQLTNMARTWTMWTLGQTRTIDAFASLAESLQNQREAVETRVTALRVLASIKAPGTTKQALVQLDHGDARLRLEAAQVLRYSTTPPFPRIVAALGEETERLVRYALWKTLAERFIKQTPALLTHKNSGVRQGALLALLETDKISKKKAQYLATGSDKTLATLAKQWLQRTGDIVPEAQVADPVKARAPLDHETTVAEVQKALPAANPLHGKELFFAAGGAGCPLCHSVGGKGLSIGPDLSDLGSRAKANYVAESILDPNATIIEGYTQALIKTNDGKEYAGMIREDTNKLLRISQPDGTSVVLKKSNIRSRELLDVSAMPGGYGTFLSAADIADISAWLMLQRTE